MAKSIKSATDKWEKFKPERYHQSLISALVPEEEIEKLIRLIQNAPEIQSSEEIYEFTYTYLKIIDRPLAARYSLKRALLEKSLQRSFVQFVGKMFMEQGYTVRIDHPVKGACVEHDTHVIIDKDSTRYLIQCTAQDEPGSFTDLSSVLSLKALFDDLSTQAKLEPSPFDCDRAWLIVNTRFTEKAIEYGSCSTIELLGWGYPEGNDICTMIKTHGLYPVTCLTGLTKTQKIILLQRNIILCKELLSYREVLKKIKVPGKYVRSILDECLVLSTAEQVTI